MGSHSFICKTSILVINIQNNIIERPFFFFFLFLSCWLRVQIDDCI